MIRFRDGYKYQLASDYFQAVPIDTPEKVVTEFIELSKDGVLLIKDGYAWDGPSGPTIPTRSFMRASLVHDALYQLMREEKIGMHNRPVADDLLYRICIEDGMWRIRAWYVRFAVRNFAAGAALPENEKKVRTAP